MTDYTQYINDYLSGTLAPEKLVELQAMLAIDKDLKEEYQIMISSREFIKARAMLEEMENDPNLEEAEKLVRFHSNRSSADSFESNLISIPPDSQQPQTEIPTPGKESLYHRPITRIRKIAIMSFTLAAVIISVFLAIRSFVPTDPIIRTYNRFYEPISEDVFDREIFRGVGGRSFHSGMECYLKEDYNCAIMYFSKLPETAYYNGLAQLGLENFEDALISFHVFQMKNPKHPGVNWYIGLTYFRLNRLEMAILYLNNLSLIENPHQSDSQKLKSKIEKIQTAERK